MKPWWRKNSGADADSIEHMVPPIRQCTRSWRLTLSCLSKFTKLFWRITSRTSAASGGIPLNSRFKHFCPVGDTADQTPCLKGPSYTQPLRPFPPNPESPLCQSSCSFDASHGLESRLQSQKAKVTLQSTLRRRFSYWSMNQRYQGRNCCASWINSKKSLWCILIRFSRESLLNRWSVEALFIALI